MQFLEAKDPEWMDIWDQLAQHPLNSGDPICLNHSHTWEYMGSTDNHHHLRHLLHPKTGRPQYIYLERHNAGILWAAAV